MDHKKIILRTVLCENVNALESVNNNYFHYRRKWTSQQVNFMQYKDSFVFHLFHYELLKKMQIRKLFSLKIGNSTILKKYSVLSLM